ncbi:hypothetical protein [Atrimonas thermophila]|uniref:hypothetical protein n=1 Tax=Atrimonas thermophila TaxID=3064161 RepID=UPI00399CB04C
MKHREEKVLRPVEAIAEALANPREKTQAFLPYSPGNPMLGHSASGIHTIHILQVKDSRPQNLGSLSHPPFPGTPPCTAFRSD